MRGPAGIQVVRERLPVPALIGNSPHDAHQLPPAVALSMRVGTTACPDKQRPRCSTGRQGAGSLGVEYRRSVRQSHIPLSSSDEPLDRVGSRRQPGRSSRLSLRGCPFAVLSRTRQRLALRASKRPSLQPDDRLEHRLSRPRELMTTRALPLEGQSRVRRNGVRVHVPQERGQFRELGDRRLRDGAPLPFTPALGTSGVS